MPRERRRGWLPGAAAILLAAACAGVAGPGPTGNPGPSSAAVVAWAAAGSDDGQGLAGEAATSQGGPAGPDDLVPGRPLERTFTVEDARLEDDSPFHAYRFEARRGQRIELVMRSDQVDPFLWLYGPDGELLGRDDDSGPGPYDAALRVQAPEDGTYRVLANTALGWQRGRYSLLLCLEDPTGVGPSGRDDEGDAGGDVGGSSDWAPGPGGDLGADPPGPGGAPGTRGLRAQGEQGTQGPAVPPVEGQLEPGVRRAGVVRNDDLLRFWRVVLPEGQDRFEVGLFDAAGPLDLVATPEVPLEPGMGDFPYKAMTGRENERLEVRLPAGAPRRWLVGVVNWEPTSIRYEIELTFRPPLPPYPEYKPPLPQTVAALSPLERAIRATVQISTPEGSASGTLVTPDGLILTSYHVVGECRFADELFGCEGGLLRDEAGKPVELIVGLSHESRGAATQYFVAEVLHALPRYDLALLRITRDLNGVPARGPIFPWIPLDLSADALRLGDEVMVIGYPAIAQTAGRIPLSLTRGVLSGFTEHEGRRVLLQTDAAIESGHSGGALVRLPEARLVGIPSDTRLDWDTFEKQNYARPVTLLPADWVETLSRHGAILYGVQTTPDRPGAGGAAR